MLIKFTKMHGLGNDFVVIDAVRQAVNLNSDIIKQLADRNLGIGCDQVLVIEPPSAKNIDFDYRIFNCDGTEVEQCGNGARCMGRYIADQNLSGKKLVRLKSKNRIMEVQLKSRTLVTVDMEPPTLEPDAIPFIADNQNTTYAIDIDGQTHNISAISMGNPHAVIRVDDINSAAVEQLGPQLQAHRQFPESVNVGFMEIVNPQHIRLRVYERGAGETQACGSGACAAAVAAIRQGLVENIVNIELLGGELSIEWQGDEQPVLMTGPTETVFHGQIKL